MRNKDSEILYANVAVAFLLAGLVAFGVAAVDTCTDLSGVWRTAKIGAFLSVVLNSVALVFGVNGKATIKGPFVAGFAICLLVLTALLICLILVGGLGM
jgi:uncharacterized membrane protein (DUF2068 family)